MKPITKPTAEGQSNIYEGTGNVADPYRRADAVKIAEEYDPFMVWSPNQQTLWKTSLFRGIACLACGQVNKLIFIETIRSAGLSQ